MLLWDIVGGKIIERISGHAGMYLKACVKKHFNRYFEFARKQYIFKSIHTLFYFVPPTGVAYIHEHPINAIKIYWFAKIDHQVKLI